LTIFPGYDTMYLVRNKKYSCRVNYIKKSERRYNMTKLEMFKKVYDVAYVADFLEKEEVLQKLEHEIELLENKSKNKKQTEKQRENEEFKKLIFEVVMSGEEPMTISDMQSVNDVLAQLKNQKISALIKQLREEGKVKRIFKKKVAYFTTGNEKEDE